MSDQRYRDSVPVVLFVSAISMVLAAFFITIALLVNVRSETLQNRQNGLITQTYNRTTNCIVTEFDESKRNSAEFVNGCYDQAEQSTGAKVERYGAAK